MEVLQALITELSVGAMLVVFAFLARSFFARLTDTINNAVKRIEATAERVQRMEVKNAEQLATMGAHIQNIFKRLDRERDNGA